MSFLGILTAFYFDEQRKSLTLNDEMTDFKSSLFYRERYEISSLNRCKIRLELVIHKHDGLLKLSFNNVKIQSIIKLTVTWILKIQEDFFQELITPW